MNPTLEQLARYVVQELERGVPEITLHAALREAGWTPEWINAALSTAKQRAVPAAQSQLNIPVVQQPPTVASPTTRPASSPAKQAPLTKPLVKRLPPRQPKTVSLASVRKAMLILIALLSVAVIGLGVYRGVTSLQQSAQQKVVRDIDRREDLSVLLSDLSDYFVTRGSYPTLSQMSTPSFREANGFTADSITDPKWSPDNAACTKDGKPALATDTTPDCYRYEVTTSKAKVSIWLEVDKKPYAVTFDKNSQVD